MPLHGQPVQRMRYQGNAATALQSINGITPDQVYKLGAEAFEITLLFLNDYY